MRWRIIQNLDRKWHMMRRLCFFARFSVTLLAALVVITVAGCVPSNHVDRTNPPIDMGGNLVDGVVSNSSMGINATTQVVQSPQLPDGQSLFGSYCTQCHIAPLLENSKKTRDDWEAVLAQMEEMGLSIEENEKEILLDYLTRAGKP